MFYFGQNNFKFDTYALECFNFSIYVKHIQWGIVESKWNLSNQIDFFSSLPKFFKAPLKFGYKVALFDIF